MKIAVLSLSGGMDSTCLLVHLLNKHYTVFCVSFDYGQKHRVEIEKAVLNVRYLKSLGYNIDHNIVDLTSIISLFHSSLLRSSLIQVPEGHYEEENMKSTFVPNRNAIFSSIIYGLALSKSILYNSEVVISLGIHSGDHSIYPDCRQEFRDVLEEAFKIGNWGSDKVSFYTPFITGDKTSILQECLENCEELGLNFDKILSNTITSYNPDSEGRSSGKSGSDIERIEAFINIGRKDPIIYIKTWDEIVEEAKKFLKK